MRHFQQWQWCYRKNITTQLNDESLRIFFLNSPGCVCFSQLEKLHCFVLTITVSAVFFFLDTYRANSWIHITAHSLGLSKSILGNVGNWKWIALERERAHRMKVKCTMHHQISPGMYPEVYVMWDSSGWNLRWGWNVLTGHILVLPLTIPLTHSNTIWEKWLDLGHTDLKYSSAPSVKGEVQKQQKQHFFYLTRSQFTPEYRCRDFLESSVPPSIRDLRGFPQQMCPI